MPRVNATTTYPSQVLKVAVENSDGDVSIQKHSFATIADASQWIHENADRLGDCKAHILHVRRTLEVA